MGMLKPALICCPVAALMTVLSWAAVLAPQPQKKAATKAPTPQAQNLVSAHKTATKPAAKTGSTRQSVRRTGTKQYRAPALWRPRQLTPSADRYKEIQTALVSRGYLPAEEATGVWGQSSVDALKRFQSEQNLESSGRISSLSLIALGLGPKHDAAVRAPAESGSPQIQ
jgi:hypothetical protein